ncbi:YhgE/Pip family protein [Fictibacillus iocasae]|uniref:YhgE/Pip family protein n=1 Tax=Fictibacillus iocasae TaxID=2715437 RepID=A0ABW2NLA8_9BACL
MSAWNLYLAELAKLKAKKGLIISVIAVLLVPLVYALIILSPTWGPYDNLSNLPVAVVNSDKGAMSGDEPINVGKDLVADLKKSKSLGWDFVTAKQAESGLKNQKYYMVIEIPEDFSSRTASVMDENPQKPELRYTQNEGLSFMAAQVTKKATEQIREQLSNKITETYTKNLFTNLGGVSSGFQSAYEGADKISGGTGELHDGTSKMLESLTAKSADISKLADGTTKLSSGLRDLLNGLQTKAGDISKLAAGTTELENGTSKLLQSLQAKSKDVAALNEGAVKVQNGASSLSAGTAQVLSGLQSAQKGTSDLSKGLKEELAPGSQKVADGVAAVDAAVIPLTAGSQGVTAALKDMLAKNPALGSDPNFLKLLGTSQAVSEGLTKLSAQTPVLKGGAALVAGGAAKAAAGSEALNQGMGTLVAGQTQVNSGAAALAEGSKLVAGGTNSINNGWGTITQGVSSLKDGAGKIEDGNRSVESGWGTMTSGVTQLHSGAVQINDGNQSVNKGWTELTDGVTKLDDGAGKLNDGSLQLADGLKNGADDTSKLNVSDQTISMFSSPLEVKGEEINKLPFYRDSNAPYILSLALFVGILLMSFVIDFKKPAVMAANGFSWFFGKAMQLGTLAVLQAVLVSITMLTFLNYEIESGFLFVLFAIFVSLTFLAIVLFLVVLAGNIGRLAALALIVMQLSTTGSNLPIDMLPENLRNLSVYLPLTYSNAGFRSLITLNDYSYLWNNAMVLLGFLILFTLLSLAVFVVQYNRNTDSQPELN